ncbi:MAG: hypothetical protein ABI334_04845 [Candidatus Dormiibacterota bacterium]
MNDFERELESELHRILDPIAAATIPLRRVTESGGIMKKLLGGAGAAIGVKLLTGLAVAAAALTVATAATEVATTGSLNPANWGQQVKQVVSECKASAERLGVHGIGQCVSSFARQHGADVKASPKAKKDNPGQDKKDNPGQGNANGKNKSNGNGNGNGNRSESSDTSTTSTGTEPTDPVATVLVNIPPQP